jgi:hypothetical protein
MPVRVSEAKPMQHICTHHLAAATAEAMRTHFQTYTRVIANTRSLHQLLRHHHLLCANVSTVSSQCQILAPRSLLCSQPIYASGRWRAYSRILQSDDLTAFSSFVNCDRKSQFGRVRNAVLSSSPSAMVYVKFVDCCSWLLQIESVFRSSDIRNTAMRK